MIRVLLEITSVALLSLLLLFYTAVSFIFGTIFLIIGFYVRRL